MLAVGDFSFAGIVLLHCMGNMNHKCLCSFIDYIIACMQPLVTGTSSSDASFILYAVNMK